MCSLSIYSDGNQLIVTSNRDENTARKSAMPPAKYMIDDKEHWFARDAEAGGTWFILTPEEQKACILLNGGFVCHEMKGNYAKSRGLVLMDLATETDTYTAFLTYPFAEVQPFTLVLHQQQVLWRLVWDGNQKHCIPLDKQKPYFFSSATLYSPIVATERESWFMDFVSKSPKNHEDILHFHRHHMPHNTDYGLVINRMGLVATQSISQVLISPHLLRYTYLDLVSPSTYVISKEI